MTLINPKPIPETGNIELEGDVWYVDGNRPNNGGDGKTWKSAFNLLSTALAVSHADIARTADRQWAGRNKIYVKADSITEDLVLFADKTDVIGVGAKDSYDMPCIVGNHVPTNGLSTRFFNIQFRGAIAAGADIITLASTSSGIVFDGCYFNGWSTTPATGGVVAVASPRLRIENCKFIGAFSDASIDLGAGDGNGTIIRNNIIESAAVGISVDASFTCANEQAFINDNRIFSTAITIDDDSDKFKVLGNYCVSGGTIGANAYDFEGTNGAGNIISGSNSATTWPLAVVS